MLRQGSLVKSLQHFFRRIYFPQTERFSRNLLRFTHSETILIVIAAVIGLATGGIILLFNYTVEFAGDSFTRLFSIPRGMSWWGYLLFPFVPALGGLLVGLLNRAVFRTNPGHGVPEVILASRFARGTLKRRTIPQQILTAALTIGSGGGGGREGPIIHVGGATGYVIAELFRLTRDQKRTLIACGAAAGISGLFNTPIGGVMFVLEVILGDFRLKTFTPVVVSSVAAAALTRSFYGSYTLLNAPSGFAPYVHEYGLFIVFGLLMGVLSAYFIETTIFVEKAAKKLKSIPAVFRPAIGGFLGGIMAAFFPRLMEQSYLPVNEALHVMLPIWLMVVLAVLKPLHASLSIASGGTGGVFAPALKSGAMMGGALGLAAAGLFPGYIHSPELYAICGMGAVLAGTMHAPLTSVLMIIELSNDYTVILPGMLTAIIASFVAQKITKHSIYTWSIDSESSRIGSFAYLPLLSSISIDQIIDYRAAHVAPNATLKEVLRVFENARHEAVLVLDADDKYMGIIEFEDVRSFITELDSISSLLAADVMTTSVQPVLENTTLDVVLRMFDDYGWSILPVLSDDEEKRAIGLVTAHDAHTYYRKSVTRE